MNGHGEEKFKVIFMGPAANDFGLVDKLVKNLQVYFRLSAQNVTKMMRLSPLTVKNGIDLKEAERYKTVLEEIGAKVRIEPMDDAGAEGIESEVPGESPLSKNERNKEHNIYKGIRG